MVPSSVQPDNESWLDSIWAGFSSSSWCHVTSVPWSVNRSSRLALPPLLGGGGGGDLDSVPGAAPSSSTLTRSLAHLVIDPDSGVEVALLRAVPIRRRLQRRREEHFEALRATQRSTERKEGGERSRRLIYQTVSSTTNLQVYTAGSF